MGTFIYFGAHYRVGRNAKQNWELLDYSYEDDKSYGDYTSIRSSHRYQKAITVDEKISNNYVIRINKQKF